MILVGISSVISLVMKEKTIVGIMVNLKITDDSFESREELFEKLVVFFRLIFEFFYFGRAIQSLIDFGRLHLSA